MGLGELEGSSSRYAEPEAEGVRPVLRTVRVGELLEMLNGECGRGRGKGGGVALPTDFPYFVGWAGALRRLGGGIGSGGEEDGGDGWP